MSRQFPWAIMAIGIIMNARADGSPPCAIPPHPLPPVGLTDDGSYPDIIELSASHNMRKVYMPTQKYYRGDVPAFEIKRSRDKPGTVLRLTLGKSPNGHALQVRYGFEYRLSKGQVVPIFDDLYLVETVAAPLVRLRRVTEEVVAELRPTEGSRSIPMNAVGPRLFWNREEQAEGRVTVLRVEPATPERAAYAEIKVQPFASVRVSSKLRPEVFTVNVQAGDLLAADSQPQAYRVLKVVPEQRLELPGVQNARLVGWVEIDPEPVEEKGEK